MRRSYPHARLCTIALVLWAALGLLVREVESDPRVLRECQPLVCGSRR